MRRFALLALLSPLLLCLPTLPARAGSDEFQNETVAGRAKPGETPKGGPVVMGTVGPDGKAHNVASDNYGNIVVTTTAGVACSAVEQGAFVVGNTSTSDPGTQLAGRAWVVYCNSCENTGSPILKILADGTVGYPDGGGAPALGVGNAGDTVPVCSCSLPYPIPATITPRLIATAVGTGVTRFQCAH